MSTFLVMHPLVSLSRADDSCPLENRCNFQHVEVGQPIVPECEPFHFCPSGPSSVYPIQYNENAIYSPAFYSRLACGLPDFRVPVHDAILPFHPIDSVQTFQQNAIGGNPLTREQQTTPRQFPNWTRANRNSASARKERKAKQGEWKKGIPRRCKKSATTRKSSAGNKKTLPSYAAKKALKRKTAQSLRHDSEASPNPEEPHGGQSASSRNPLPAIQNEKDQQIPQQSNRLPYMHQHRYRLTDQEEPVESWLRNSRRASSERRVDDTECVGAKDEDEQLVKTEYIKGIKKEEEVVGQCMRKKRAEESSDCDDLMKQRTNDKYNHTLDSGKFSFS